MSELLAVLDPQIIFWLVLMIVFIVAELMTEGLVSIWFAAGSLISLIIACFSDNVIVQIILFLVVSIALVIATRPWAKKFLNSRTKQTNSDRIIGEEICIVEAVSNRNQTGMANVHGREWTVRSSDDHVEFSKGELARVVKISGVKLIVEKITNS